MLPLKEWLKPPAPISSKDITPSEFRLTMFVYCVREGATRGIYYGSIYGVMLFVVGVLWGCPVGLITGIFVGALDAVLLMALHRWRQKHGACLPKLTTLAQLLIPPVTCVASDLMFRILYRMQTMPIGFYEIPALLAGYAAWEAARKMRGWYLE